MTENSVPISGPVEYGLSQFIKNNFQTIILTFMAFNTFSTFVMLFGVFWNVLYSLFNTFYYVFSSLFSLNSLILSMGVFIGAYSAQKYNFRPVIDYFHIDEHVDAFFNNKNVVSVSEYLKNMGPMLVSIKESFINAANKISHMQK